MVIFGGLELVAAGLLVHQFDKNKQRRLEQEDDQRRQDRKDRKDRKRNQSHHRERPRPAIQPYGLYPPKDVPGRPNSAPPSQYPMRQYTPGGYPRPAWQPQQDAHAHAHAQNWQPRPPLQQQQQQQPQQPQPQQDLYAQNHNNDYKHPYTPSSETLHSIPGPPMYMSPQSSGSQMRSGAAPSASSNFAEPGQYDPRAYNTYMSPAPHDSYAELSGSAPMYYAPPSSSPHVRFAQPGGQPQPGGQSNGSPPEYRP